MKNCKFYSSTKILLKNSLLVYYYIVRSFKRIVTILLPANMQAKFGVKDPTKMA